MGEFNYFNNLIDQKILNIHTGYLAIVVSVQGNTARLQPLSMYKAAGGEAKKQSVVSVVVPDNIKYKTENITYRTSDTQSKTMTVLVPDSLAAGDIVFAGVCERDITYAKDGIISQASNRHHNINDSVILRVL